MPTPALDIPRYPTLTIDPDSIQKLGDLAADGGISRIHILAWRDLDDVEAGGSELHAHEVARLWAQAGIEVVMRTSFAAGHPSVAERDGYKVIRKAGRHLVFPRAAASEALRRHGPRDAIVEIWNGMPFLSPMWTRTPRVVLLHHIHAEMWDMALPRPLARLGNTIESKIGPRLYRSSRMITLSDSSKQEMLDVGFRDHLVEVVPPGIDPHFSAGGTRSATPLVVAVGRLMPVKRFDRLIRAVVAARRPVPDIELRIVGTGAERAALEALIVELDAADYITFAGRVSDDELVDLYRSAWMVASSSVREGWGMTLTEAAACGTPAVATRIAGHVDAINEGASGLLADDDADLTRLITQVARDDELRSRLQAGALTHASSFTWLNTATRILGSLVDEARGRSPQRPEPSH